MNATELSGAQAPQPPSVPAVPLLRVKRYKLIGVIFPECFHRADAQLKGPLYCEACERLSQIDPGDRAFATAAADTEISCHEHYDPVTGAALSYRGHTPEEIRARRKTRVKAGHYMRCDLPWRRPPAQGPCMRRFLQTVGRIWNGPSYWSSGSRSTTTIRVKAKHPQTGKPYKVKTQWGQEWKYVEKPYPGRHQRLVAFKDEAEARAWMKPQFAAYAYGAEADRAARARQAPDPHQARQLAAQIDLAFWSWARLSKVPTYERVDNA